MRYSIEPADTSRADAHTQALHMLARLIGHPVVLEHNAAGAPYLPQLPSLHVSISHCRRAVAVAVCEEHCVGIDVECRRKISPSLVARVCSETEQQAVADSDDPSMEFLCLWTRKEAVLKCLGTGIQGFGSLVDALATPGVEVQSLPTPLSDTVAAIAFATGE